MPGTVLNNEDTAVNKKQRFFTWSYIQQLRQQIYTMSCGDKFNGEKERIRRLWHVGDGGSCSIKWSGRASLRKWHMLRDLKKEKEQAMWTSRAVEKGESSEGNTKTKSPEMGACSVRFQRARWVTQCHLQPNYVFSASIHPSILSFA